MTPEPSDSPPAEAATVSVAPPIGGRRDSCGVCGKAITDRHVATVALNGYICESCTLNIGAYTPVWYAIGMAGQETLQCWEYGTYLGGPFEGSPKGLVYLDFDPGTADSIAERVKARRYWYASLDEDVQELIWTVGTDALPDRYTVLQPDYLDDYSHCRYFSPRSFGNFSRDDRDDHPLTEVLSYLPRPFAVTSEQIIAPADRLPPHIDALLSADGQDPTDAAYHNVADDWEGAGTASEPADTDGASETSASAATATDDDDQSDTSEQAGLGSFGVGSENA